MEEKETKTYVNVDDLIKQAEDQFKQFIKDGKYKHNNIKPVVPAS